MITLERIREFAQTKPEVSALVHGKSFMTWAGLLQGTQDRVELLSEQYAQALPQHGCFISRNCIKLIPWITACTTLGIPLTGIDYTLESDVIIDTVKRIGATVVFYSSETTPDFQPPQLDGSIRFIDIDAEQSIDSPAPEASNDATHARASHPSRFISLTSGTSGQSKIVVRTSSFDQRRFQYFTNKYQFNADDNFLLSMPLYHAAGIGWAKLFLSLGAEIHIADIESPESLARSIVEDGIRVTIMHPHLLRMVLDHLSPNGSPLDTQLRWVLIGGKDFPVDLKTRALGSLGNVIYEYYGTTETGVNTVAEPRDLASHPCSVGRPIESTSIAILDYYGRTLSSNVIGTVAVSSYMNMDNYDDASSNEILIGGQRYLCTSDHGYLDDSGRLYLMNRAQGEHSLLPIYRVENLIRNIDEVSDVYIWAKDHSTYLDCVVTTHTALDDSDALIRSIAHIAATENVDFDRIDIVDHIPYSPSGKVQTKKLRLPTRPTGLSDHHIDQHSAVVSATTHNPSQPNL